MFSGVFCRWILACNVYFYSVSRIRKPLRIPIDGGKVSKMTRYTIPTEHIHCNTLHDGSWISDIERNALLAEKANLEQDIIDLRESLEEAKTELERLQAPLDCGHRARYSYALAPYNKFDEPNSVTLVCAICAYFKLAQTLFDRSLHDEEDDELFSGLA